MELQQLDQVEMGERIRKYRQMLNLTREQLAEQLDVSCKFIGDIECGAKGMSLKRFCSLTQILGVSADILMFDSTHNHRLICEIRYYVE